MTSRDDLSAALRRNEELAAEIEKLRAQLIQANSLHSVSTEDPRGEPATGNDGTHAADSLTPQEISRYSRQLLLPEWHMSGQLNVRNSHVLVVGAGGLGSPVCMYLAGAGVGTIGIVDYDVIEATNLHRQIMHREGDVGQPKAASAARAIRDLNSHVRAVVHNEPLSSSNALDIIGRYEIVADCSDNVPTRYLVNDACVLLGKTLVSASAVKFEGQLTTYNAPPGKGCYRCLFPTPPSAANVANCSDAGVLGPVPGAIGCLQAFEILRIASGLGASYSNKMLLFDGYTGAFRTVKLKGRDPGCAVCGETPTVTSLPDYAQWCGGRTCDKTPGVTLLDAHERMTCAEYQRYRDAGAAHVLLDVRSMVQYGICALPGSVNVPLGELSAATVADLIRDKGVETICICRRGNSSQHAVRRIKDLLGQDARVRDVIGGLEAWARDVDSSFPMY